MLDVLIVDDELLMRDALKAIIDWEGQGFKIVGDTYNGAEALKVLKQRHVDIVLTDIKMPVMDGLELIKSARTGFPHVRFIVLSAYDEFHMVSKAFKLGASEYFLKSEMIQEDIINVLKRLELEIKKEKLDKIKQEEQIEKEVVQKLKVKNLEKCILINKEAIKEKLFKDIIWGIGVSIENEIRELEELNLRLEPNSLRILNIKVDNYAGLEKSAWSGARELFKFAILNVIQEMLDIHKLGDVFCNVPGEFVVVCSLKCIGSQNETEGKLHLIFNDIHSAIEKCFNASISGGLSEIADGYENLSKLYYQSLMACDYSFIKGRGRLIGYSTLPFKTREVAYDYLEYIKRLKNVLSEINPETVNEKVEMLTFKCEDILPQYIKDVKNIFCQYYVCIMEYVQQNRIYDNVCDLLASYNDYLKENGDLTELNAWIGNITAKIAGASGESTRLIIKAKNCIHANYSKDISLGTVADELGISTSYLSRIFVKEMHCNFVDYLAKVRIDASLKLMRESNMKIYEIAAMVGFTNSEYFSRTFKKIIGKSPKEFMK